VVKRTETNVVSGGDMTIMAPTYTSAVPGIRSATAFIMGLGSAGLLMATGFLLAIVVAPHYATPLF
jgi:hypothetical protein